MYVLAGQSGESYITDNFSGSVYRVTFDNKYKIRPAQKCGAPYLRFNLSYEMSFDCCTRFEILIKNSFISCWNIGSL